MKNDENRPSQGFFYENKEVLGIILPGKEKKLRIL